MRRVAPLIVAALLCSTGCAVCYRHNRPATNWVEAHLVPKKEPARRGTLPATVPLRALAVGLDAAVVHPASRIDDAYFDAARQLWADDTFDWEGQPFEECAMLFSRAAVTPFAIVGNFIELGWMATDRTRPPEAADADATKP